MVTIEQFRKAFAGTTECDARSAAKAENATTSSATSSAVQGAVQGAFKFPAQPEKSKTKEK